MSDTLTPDAVLAMPAGDEMDRLVAKAIDYWQCRFSSDRGHVGKLIDWLRERWGTISIAHNGINWQVMELVGPDLVAYADTLPLALCRAALLETLRTEGK